MRLYFTIKIKKHIIEYIIKVSPIDAYVHWIKQIIITWFVFHKEWSTAQNIGFILSNTLKMLLQYLIFLYVGAIIIWCSHCYDWYWYEITVIW